MADIFEFFGLSGSASPSLLAAFIVEPLLQLIGYIAFLVVSFMHFRKTKSNGALVIFCTLLLSAISSVAIEYFASFLDDANYGLVEIASRIIDALLFIVLVWGFYLVCRQQSNTIVVNQS